MTITTRLTRIASGVAVATLAATGLSLAAAPAQAAPVFEVLDLEHSAQINRSGPCSAPAPALSVPSTIALGENSSRATKITASQTMTANGNLLDSLTISAVQSGTASSTTKNGQPATVRLSYASTQKVTAPPAGSVCTAKVTSDLKYSFRVTTTTPMWATLSYSKKGAAYAEAYVWSETNDPYEDLYGTELKGSGSTTVLLPPGKWGGYLRANPYSGNRSTSTTLSASGVIQVAFAPVGSAVSGPSGKAQSYAALAKTRSCSTHTLSAKLTTSSKKIKRISKVSFAVNGKTVKTLRGTAVKRGAAVKLRLGDESAASVKTTVRFKTGKTSTARASYRPCS